MEEILNQKYINSKDLSKITGMHYQQCLKIIDACRVIMKDKQLYVPGNAENARNRLALTSIVRKYLGI